MGKSGKRKKSEKDNYSKSHNKQRKLFFCNELMLAIEIDGCSHNERSEEDQIRQAKLESLGIRFLRFYDVDIKKNIHGVLWVIGDWIRKYKDEPTPNPSQEGNKKVP